MKSLRGRLVAGLILTVTAVLAGNGFLMYSLLKRRMMTEVEESLVSELRSNAGLLTHEVFLGRRGPFPELSKREDLLFQCWSPDGSTVYRSDGLGSESLERLAADLDVLTYEEIERENLHFAEVVMPTGCNGHAVALHFAPPPRPEGPPPPRGDGQRRPQLKPVPYEIVLAQDLCSVKAALRELRGLIVVAWLTSSLACATILGWTVNRSLRPIHRLRRQLAELDATRLDQRLDGRHAPTELQPLIAQLNVALGRLADSFERERSFSSDVAHELRTPVSGLRSMLELELSKDRSPAESRATAERCLEVTVETQHLIEALLDLTRGAEATPPGDTEAVDLRELTKRSWEPFAEIAGERGVDLDLAVPAGLSVRTHHLLAARILTNLLENAASYGDAGGAVRVEAGEDEGGWHLTVSNPATDAPADVAERAFDTFWRADSARSATGKHAGLGLALSRRLAESLGGRLAARLDEERRFHVELRVGRATM